MIASSQQHASFTMVLNKQQMNVSAVYASTSYIERKKLWLELATLQQSHLGPWCFIGDFNAILGAHDKRRGRLPLAAACEEFQAWSDSCNLTHVLTYGASFTWSNMISLSYHTKLILDKAVCNDDCFNSWDSVSCCTLTRSQLDHHHILLIIKKGSHVYPSSFKFHSIWIDHLDCKRLVTKIWSKPYHDCPMFILIQKLKF